MASYSPVKLTIEEQVPFTPPKSLQIVSSAGSNSSSVTSSHEADQSFDHSLTNISNRNIVPVKKGKRTGCGNCPGCLSKDCGNCKMCRDMIKFGGRGIKKQKCIHRKCSSPSWSNKGKRTINCLDISPIVSMKKRRISAHRISTSSESDASSSSSSSCIIISSPSNICYNTPSVYDNTMPTINTCIPFTQTTPTLTPITTPITCTTLVMQTVLPPTNIATPTKITHILQTTPTKATPSQVVTRSPNRFNSNLLKCSPRKFNSPLKKGSPLKQKLIKHNDNVTTVNTTTKPGLTTPLLDSAPYSNLIHVNQNLISTTEMGGAPLKFKVATPTLPTAQSTDLSLGTVTMATSHPLKKSLVTKRSSVVSLTEDNNMKLLLQRYTVLKSQLKSLNEGTCNTNDLPTTINERGLPITADERGLPTTTNKRGLPPSNESTTTTTNERGLPITADNDLGLSLNCKIFVKLKGKKLLVDCSRYKEKRQSLRLKNKKNEVLCEDPLPSPSLPPSPTSLVPLPSPSFPNSSPLPSSLPPLPIYSAKFGQDLWTDHYQPRSSAHFISNQNSVHQLYVWLKQWKDICDGKSPLPQQLDDSLNSSFMDEEKEEILPTATLITGPIGVGKTALVYACAHELGFKVLEINSTTVRSRQNILSMLKEATLSHQVMIKEKQAPVVVKDAKSSGLLSFFTPKSNTQKFSQKEKENNDGRSHTVALATATVILFEEVDILFDEECRGFWSAVYEILSLSKRPMIFTANDSKLNLDYPHKSIILTPPTQNELALHCQLLSLSHDCHMTFEEANLIIRKIGKDTRKLFNWVQFWLSGYTHQTDSSLPFIVEEEISKLHDPLQSLINNKPVNKTGNYYELDQCIVLSENQACLDIFQSCDRSCDLMWWQSKSNDSLCDKLGHRPVTCNCQWDHVYEMMSLIEWEPVHSTSSIGMSPLNINRKEDIWNVQRTMTSHGLFHLRNNLSKWTLVTELLPIVHVICKYESIREEMKTSRRFTHYLSYSNNTSDHLKQFLSLASFPSPLPVKIT